MSEHLPAILVLAPLFGSIFIALFGMRNQRACFPIVISSLLISMGAALGLAAQVASGGKVDYFFGGWNQPLGIGIMLRIDPINALVVVTIAVIAILAAIYSIRPLTEQNSEKRPLFYILYLLLCVGLFGITATRDAFNLFVLIEVTALSSYGLVALGSSRRSKVAAFHYLIMGTVGASFYLLGVGYLFLRLGSLNMEDIHTILAGNEELANSRAVRTAFIFILVGVWTKMAFFPLHGWLPNAYSYCPSSSANILAPLVTKVSVYVMIRMMVSVFGLDRVAAEVAWSDLVVVLAIAAIVAGSMMALAHRELKKMLCGLIVAEIGYMVGGAWVGDAQLWGITGATYHILADALMTFCMFVAAGIFAKHLGAFELKDLDGVFRKMPLVSAAFIVGGLSLIGVPPTCGFFSKFYLIRGGIGAGDWAYVGALIFSSLVNAVLFFRIFEIAYFGKNPVSHHGHGDDHGHTDHHGEPAAPATAVPRVPLNHLLPLLISAALLLLLGIFNGPVVEFIRSGLLQPSSAIVSLP